MLTMKRKFATEGELECYLRTQSWGGAKPRIEEMSNEEMDWLLRYLLYTETELTDTEIKDFIWFDWEDIYTELKAEEDAK